MSTAAANTPGAEKQFKNKGLMDVAKADELKQLGWRTENLDSGFSAYEINGERKIGPFDSMAELTKAVKEEVGNRLDLPPSENSADEPELSTLDADSKGNTYLPGHGPQVIKELADAAIEYDRIKMERVNLSAKEKEAKDTLTALMKKYEDRLEVDPDTGEKLYTAGDVTAVLVVTESETVKTRHADPGE